MKLILAIIQPAKLEAVKEALSKVEVFRMTIVDVQGFGRQKGNTEVYRGHELTVNLLRKVQLQIAVNEDFVEPTVNAIMEAGRTGPEGRIGDGKIFIVPLEDCLRIPHRRARPGGDLMPNAILLSDDLMFTSRIAGTARDLGLSLNSARSPTALLEAARRQPPTCVIVDLANDGLDLAVLMKELEELPNPPRVVAYGSHVDAASLQAARAAGCAVVLPAQQIRGRVTDISARLVSAYRRSKSRWVTKKAGQLGPPRVEINYRLPPPRPERLIVARRVVAVIVRVRVVRIRRP